jgi:DNA end-binding protein Ku
MMAYTLRYQNGLHNHLDYFRDIKDVEVGDEMLNMAEALITKKAAKFDLGKFQDGYAVRELVDAKLKHLPIPKDEAPKARPSNVVNLMDAFRKSIGTESTGKKLPPKKPAASAKKPRIRD